MASYRGVKAVLTALEDFFARRLPADLRAEPVNAHVTLLGSADVSDRLSGNLLGIYLHRLTIDPHGRSRGFSSQGLPPTGRYPELPVNLHFLLIANASSATIEADLIAWAMVALANQSQLDVSHLHDIDDDWSEREILTISPDEMSTEDLMRIWDVFESPYTMSVPYVARTIRLRLDEERSEGPPVVTRVFPGGRI